MSSQERPLLVIVTIHGVDYYRNLATCRRALVRCIVEDGLNGVGGLANAAHTSRSTVSRYLSGHALAPATVMKILRVLKLSFDDVHAPVPDKNAPV
jgi:hypothetical protein